MRILRISMLINLVFVLNVHAEEHTKDSLSKIQESINVKKAVLVDVREKKEWDQGHVEGALLLPLSTLRDGVTKAELKPLPKDKVLYLHCRSGGRCLVAGEILRKQGYDVRPVKSGYDALISAGFPKAME